MVGYDQVVSQDVVSAQVREVLSESGSLCVRERKVYLRKVSTLVHGYVLHFQHCPRGFQRDKSAVFSSETSVAFPEGVLVKELQLSLCI